MTVHFEMGKYAIESSNTCWSICKKGSKKVDGVKEDCWIGFMFYNTLESAMKALYELELRTSDAQSVAELVKVMRSASQRIVDTCAPTRAENALELKSSNG